MEKKADQLKILVIVLDNLGDAVMASAVLGPIRRKFPGACIGLWVKSYAAGLFADHPDVDRLHACDTFWDGSPGRGRGSFKRFFQVVAEIRKEGYGAALILNAEWRRCLAAILAFIPKRIGYARRKSAVFLTRWDLENKDDHFVDQHRKLLEAWWKEGVSPEGCLPRLVVSPQEREKARLALRQAGWNDKFMIAAHPFSGDPKKNWPLDRWAALLNKLFEKNRDLRFLFVCDAGERPALQQCLEALPPESYQFCAGAPLQEVAAFLSLSSLAIGGDSGPGHIAAAVGTPVVSLFGFTEPNRSRAVGRRAVKIIKKNPLSELEVSEVESAVTELLSSPAMLK